MTKKIIKKDVDSFNDIIVTKQGDNVQRSGVLTISQEKMLFERAGKALNKTVAKNIKDIDNEIVEQKKLQESIDIFDEKRRLDKEIENNTKKYKNLKEEQKKYIEKLKIEQEKTKELENKTEQ